MNGYIDLDMSMKSIQWIAAIDTWLYEQTGVLTYRDIAYNSPFFPEFSKTTSMFHIINIFLTTYTRWRRIKFIFPCCTPVNALRLDLWSQVLRIGMTREGNKQTLHTILEQPKREESALGSRQYMDPDRK